MGKGLKIMSLRRSYCEFDDCNTHTLSVCVFLLGAYFDPFSVLVSVLMLYFSLRLSDLVVLTRVCVCVCLFKLPVDKYA